MTEEIAAADAAAQAAFLPPGGFDKRLWCVLNSDLAIGLSESDRQAMLERLAAVEGDAEAIYRAAASEQGTPQPAWENVNPVRKAAFVTFAAWLET